MERKKIYEIIDGERDYQDSRWKNPEQDTHEPESWIIYIEHYLTKAKVALSTQPIPTAYLEAMDNMRKVVALGVRCMEVHGVPRRTVK